MKKTSNSNKQINRAYHSALKKIIKGSHEKEIYDALSAGKNSYLRLDRLASSSFDKSWIEVIEGCIFDLGEIIANPRQHTKITGNLTPVELAKKVTSESVQHLASHTQYIKEVDEYGNVIPSKILSMSSDDDLHTYENRFIATFVRRLFLFISKRYEFVSKFAELHNEEILYFKNKSIVDGAEVEIETKIKVSYKNENEETRINSGYVERIKQTRDYISYFYNSPFMKQMKNEKDVRNPIVQTNIIRKSPKYRHCYEVYRFIETYDHLGVNYKVDENYSMFNNEELAELNRTLFANYVTLRGNDGSREKKVNNKVYKPRILTSLEDESFIYGPLLEGPISFARVDDGYQAYLDSKIKKDLPLHPTKKEKEYYEDEYTAKKENQQDQKAKADLLKRRQKEVNAFEKKVKGILAKREEARLKLIEAEKNAIRQEEEDLVNAMRREIIAASQKDVTEIVNANNGGKPSKKANKEENKEYNPTVSFNDAADEIWPQLNNPTPMAKPVEEVKVTPAPAKKAKTVKPAPVVEQAPAEQKPVEAKPAPQPVRVEKVYVPTVSFNDAADEIWPQLNNPKSLPKEEPKVAPAQKPAPKKAEPAPAPAKEPVKEETKPKGKPIKKYFYRSDGTVAIIYKKDKAHKEEKLAPVKEEPKKVEPVKEQPKAEPKKEEKKENKPQNVVKSKKTRKNFRK